MVQKVVPKDFQLLIVNKDDTNDHDTLECQAASQKKHAHLKSFKIFLLLFKKITFWASIGSIISFKPSCKLASTKSICC